MDREEKVTDKLGLFGFVMVCAVAGIETMDST